MLTPSHRHSTPTPYRPVTLPAKFYIHLDSSEDDTLDILEEYIGKDERVRIFHVPSDSSSRGDYNHRERCAVDNVDRGRWILFLEPDEFVFSANGISLSHHMQLNCSEAVKVSVNLKMFGASGHRVRPSSLVIESYDKWNKWAPSDDDGYSPAQLLNAGLCEERLNGRCSLQTMERELLESGHDASQGVDATCPTGVLGNKYATKSVEEYLSRAVLASLVQKSSDTAADLAWHALVLRLSYNLLRMEDTEAAFSEAIEKTPDLPADGKAGARQVSRSTKRAE